MADIGLLSWQSDLQLVSEAEETSFQSRRLHLTANFRVSTAKFTDLPVLDFLFSPHQVNKFINHSSYHTQSNLQKAFKRCSKSFSLLPILKPTPPRLLHPFEIRLSLASIPTFSDQKILTENPHHYRLQLLTTPPTYYFTDGSCHKKGRLCVLDTTSYPITSSSKFGISLHCRTGGNILSPITDRSTI